MQCLNIRNKEVAALLKEYTEILGDENAAYYVLSENNGYGLDMAPNGEPSKLFSDLLEINNGDKATAVREKSKIFTTEFKNWFGDWLSDDKTNVSKVVDNNGEPLVGNDTLAGQAYMNICKRIMGEEVPLLDLSEKSGFWNKLKSIFSSK